MYGFVALLLCVRLAGSCPGLLVLLWHAECHVRTSCNNTFPRPKAPRPPRPGQANICAATNCVDAACCWSCRCCCVGTPWAPWACAPYDAACRRRPWFSPSCLCPSCLPSSSSRSSASWGWTTPSPRSYWTKEACCRLWGVRVL